MRHYALAALALTPVLGACAASSGGVAAPGRGRTPQAIALAPTAPVRAPERSSRRIAEPRMMPGLEGVIGASQTELARQFGAPRLEVWEGDARKLQFSGSACVLDVYLYPTSRGSELHATYVDARRSSDGREVDRATCVAALRPPPTPALAPASPKR